MCLALASSSTVAVSDAASCTMAAASSSCASAGPSEPTAPTQAQHVARWIDVAGIPTGPSHSVWPAISDVANSQCAHACAVIEAQKFSEIPLARILHPHIVFLAGSDVVNPQRAQACAVIEAREYFHNVRIHVL